MEKKVIAISPISIFKRIAFFLCDLVITFFFGLMLTNFAIFPIGRTIIDFDEKINTINKCESNKLKILQDNEILLFEDTAKKSDFNSCLQFTFESFTKNFVEDKENETVIYRYFVNYRNDKNTYISLFNKLNENQPYFIVNETVRLKDEYKNLFAPYFDPTDNLSEQGEKEFSNFQECVFVDIYGEVIKDIKAHDLTSGDLSYVLENSLSNKLNESIGKFYSFSTIIGYVFVSIVSFILIPISNENRFTLSQFFLRTNRVDCVSMKPISKRRILIASIIQLIANMGLIVFIPSLTIGVEASFALPYLSIFSLLAVLYSIISLLFIIFNKFNKSLYDIFSNSVVISREDFENILYNVGTKNGTTK